MEKVTPGPLDAIKRKDQELARAIEDFKENLPRCDECGCHPFDSKYDELTKVILEVGITANIAAYITLGLLLIGGHAMATVEIAARSGAWVADKLGYESYGDLIRSWSPILAFVTALDEWSDRVREDVRWEVNGKRLCYHCK